MDPDVIRSALRSRTQQITAEEMLKDSENTRLSIDHYEEALRQTTSIALKQEQRCSDLLKQRQEQVNKIKKLSDMITPEKLSRARDLLHKKEELLEKKKQLDSFLKTKNISTSDLQARKRLMTNHDAKIAYLNYVQESCEETRSVIEYYKLRQKSSES